MRGGVYYPSQAGKLSDAVRFGNTSNTVKTGYYKLAECTLGGSWQECMARFEFVDPNHVNQMRELCGVELCVIDVYTRFSTLCRLLYGSSQYLNNVYLSYPSTMETPSVFELYYFNDNLNYDEIAVKILYGVRRADNNTDTQDWTVATPSDPVSSLPADKTNVTLASIMQKVTEAKSAETDADGNTIVNTSTEQTIDGQKTFTKTVHFDVDNNYSMGIDGIPAGNYKDIVFNDEGGDRIATIRVQNNTDDTSPNTSILIGSNGPEHTVPAGVAIIRYATRTKVEVVQPPASANNAEVATTSWVVDKGYLTAVPAASQTVLGGVKVYTDSEGYFCIDNE